MDPTPPHIPHPPRHHLVVVIIMQGPGRIPSSRSGEILDLSKDTFHHPAVREPWCELSPPLMGLGSFDILRDRSLPGAYERVKDKGGAGGDATTAIHIVESGRK